MSNVTNISSPSSNQSSDSSTSDFNNMMIHVKILNSSATLNVEPGTSIRMVKEKYENQENISQDQQNLLFFGGSQLLDDRTIGKYGITNGSTVFLLLPVVGATLIQP